jgi:hypothetical protein
MGLGKEAAKGTLGFGRGKGGQWVGLVLPAAYLVCGEAEAGFSFLFTQDLARAKFWDCLGHVASPSPRDKPRHPTQGQLHGPVLCVVILSGITFPKGLTSGKLE